MKFKVTGISTLNGVTKVRFANDFVSRVKILNKGGHTDINLVEMPEALTKAECVTYLKTTPMYGEFVDAINIADHKYNGASMVKVSMDALVARAEAKKVIEAGKLETPVVANPESWDKVDV